MPLARIWCADPGLKRKGQRVSLPIDECLKCALSGDPPCNYEYPVLAAMYRDDGQGPVQQRGDSLSTTAITGPCVRQLVLERKVNYIEHPDDMWARFMGTTVHGILEGNIPEGWWGEKRVIAPVPGMQRFISCKPDLVNPIAGILDDYKKAKKFPQFGYVYGDQQAQLQVNRWIIDHAEWVGDTRAIKNEDGTESPNPDWVKFEDSGLERPEAWDQLRIVYITEDGMDVHPVKKRIKVPNKNGDGEHTRWVADIWSDEEVEEYLVPRYLERMKALQAWPDEVPPIPDDIDKWGKSFPCGYCPVRDECMRLEIEEGR